MMHTPTNSHTAHTQWVLYGSSSDQALAKMLWLPRARLRMGSMGGRVKVPLAMEAVHVPDKSKAHI